MTEESRAISPIASFRQMMAFGCALTFLAFCTSCKKDDEIEGICMSNPAQVFLDYHRDTLFAIAPTGQLTSNQFRWQSGEISSFLVPNAAGNYTVAMTDSRGCEAANAIKLGCSNGEFNVRDIEGNTYNVVEIGGQCWCTENLRVKQTTRGVPLQQAGNWSSAASYSRLIADADSVRKGLHYNALSALADVCPVGWRVPSQADWTTLFNNLGGAEVAALKLRSAMLWDSGQGNNASGIGAVPAGFASSTGAQLLNPEDAYFWNSSNAGYQLPNGAERAVQVISATGELANIGLNIRCMKDASEAPAEIDTGIPKILTTSAADVSFFSATLNGKLEDTQGNPLISIGFRWWKSLTPIAISTITVPETSIGLDGNFSVNIENLAPDTEYRFVAFASNMEGEGVGQTLEFSTLNVPISFAALTITELAPDEVNIAFDASVDPGIPNIESLGILVGKSTGQPLPDFNNALFNLSVSGSVFNADLSDVLPKNQYYVRPYAVINGNAIFSENISTMLIDRLHWSNNDDELITDVFYQDVSYGSVLLNEGRVWMTSNLRAQSFADGVEIPRAIIADLASRDSAAYTNLPSRPAELGLLYNGITINQGNLCPEGWRVPSRAEVQALYSWLGDVYNGNEAAVAESMRSANWEGTNESGLNFLEGGFVNVSESGFVTQYNPLHTFVWTSTSQGEGQYYFGTKLQALTYPAVAKIQSAFSVRCLRDRNP